MNCPHCRNELPIGAPFCPHCKKRPYVFWDVDYADFVDSRIQHFTGREWVFQRLEEWLTLGEEQAFFLSGAPGSGKSALAVRLWLISQEDDLAVRYPCLSGADFIHFHFCQSQDTRTQAPLRFINSLSLSLAHRYPKFAEALIEVGTFGTRIVVHQDVQLIEGGQATAVEIRNLHVEGLAARVAFDRVVRQPLDALYGTAPNERILIVVDGLDEALRYDQKENLALLLGEISRLKDLPDTVRLLLISRADDRVREAVRAPTLDLDKDAPGDINLQDVREFALRRLKDMDDEQRGKWAERVAQEGQGNFLVAQYLVRALRRGKAPHELPKAMNLSEQYEQFLERQFQSLEEWLAEPGRPLRVLAVARGEGLTREQLKGITGLPMSEIHLTLRTSSQFLTGVRGDGPIQFYHLSFREYLLENAKYPVYPEEIHEAIVDFYLTECQQDPAACDRYGLLHLPWHLFQAKDTGQMRELLFDFRWLQAKLQAADIGAVLEDYDLLEGDAEICLVRDALRLSAHVLGRDKAQLTTQLLGRLAGFRTEPGISALLKGAADWTGEVWFHPLTSSLSAPGEPLVRTLSGPARRLHGVDVTSDGKWAVSALAKELKVWDQETGRAVRILKGHEEWVEAVAILPGDEQIISASRDGALKIWDLQKGCELGTLTGHVGRVNDVAIASDTRHAVSCSDDKTLKVWDLETHGELNTLEGHGSWVRAVAVTPNGRLAVSGSTHSGQNLRVWDLAAGRQLRVLEGHEREITALAITVDGQRAVSVSRDRSLKMWDLATGQAIHTLTGHNDRILGVAITADGSRAVSASEDQTLRVWDLVEGQEVCMLQGHADRVYDVALLPDETYAISASHDGSLKIWDLTITARPHLWPGHVGWVRGVAVTPDGKKAISASRDRTLRIWDLPTGGLMYTLRGHEGPVEGVAVSPDGQYVVSASRDRMLKVWDLSQEREICTLKGHEDRIYDVAVTPDGERLVSASRDRTLKIWDLSQERELATLEGHDHEVLSVAVTPDGWRAVSASEDGTLKVWDLSSKAEVRTLEGHEGPVRAVAIVPDGAQAVSASADGTLMVWDLKTGQESRTLKRQSRGLNGVAITADGRYAISAGADGRVKIWDLGTGQSLATFLGDGGLAACAVTPDGQTVVAGELTGRVHFLRLRGLP